MSNINKPAIWFPTIQTRSGSDVFTKRLVAGLQARGLRSEIFWLPHHAEFLPWLFPQPKSPKWANIVHVNTWMHHRFIPLDKPIVSTIHHCVNDSAFTPYKKPLQRIYHNLWVRRNELTTLTTATKNVAVSKYTATATAQIYNTDDITIIPLGIDTARAFYPEDRSSKPHKPFRLLFIGNWSARKGVDLLLPIIKALGDGFELWVLTGLRNKNLKNHIGIHNIKYIPPCGDEFSLANLYRQCDALLFPSRLEGFGLVALEAQACGLPVIATRGSALPEVVADGITGILCEQDNIKDFVSAARLLNENTELWRSFKKNGPIRIQDEFTTERMANQYISLYEMILSSA